MIRILSLALGLAWVATPLGAQQSLPPPNPALLESVDPDQRRVTEEIVRDYLLRHPEIVLEAIRILQAREQAVADEQAAQAMAAGADALRSDPLSPVGGNPEGDVTVVEFFDYACPYCRNAHPLLSKLMTADANIRIVYKEYPILGEASVYASRVALAVFLLEPQKYERFHANMFQTRGRLAAETAVQVALDLGLDRSRLMQTAESDEVSAILTSNVKLAQSIGINGTPAFVIGDSIVPGLVPLEQLQALVSEARESCRTC